MSNFIPGRSKQICLYLAVIFLFPLSFVFYNIAKVWMLPVRKRKSMPTLVLQEKRDNKCWFLTKFTAALNILLLRINYFSLKLLLPLTGHNLAQINLNLFQLSSLELKVNQLSKQRPNQRPNQKPKQRQNKMPKRKQLFICSHLIVLQWALEARRWIQQALQ